MTSRDRRDLVLAVSDEVLGVLDRLPYGVPQVVLDAFVDALHVAFTELGRDGDEYTYEDLYGWSTGACSDA